MADLNPLAQSLVDAWAQQDSMGGPTDSEKDSALRGFLSTLNRAALQISPQDDGIIEGLLGTVVKVIESFAAQHGKAPYALDQIDRAFRDTFDIFLRVFDQVDDLKVKVRAAAVDDLGQVICKVLEQTGGTFLAPDEMERAATEILDFFSYAWRWSGNNPAKVFGMLVGFTTDLMMAMIVRGGHPPYAKDEIASALQDIHDTVEQCYERLDADQAPDRMKDALGKTKKAIEQANPFLSKDQVGQVFRDACGV